MFTVVLVNAVFDLALATILPSKCTKLNIQQGRVIALGCVSS